MCIPSKYVMTSNELLEGTKQFECVSCGRKFAVPEDEADNIRPAQLEASSELIKKIGTDTVYICTDCMNSTVDKDSSQYKTNEETAATINTALGN